MCLVAMQSLSVATPNKYLCEGVDFHPVNQHRQTCQDEANGYSAGCYDWYGIGVCVLGCKGCECGIVKLP